MESINLILIVSIVIEIACAMIMGAIAQKRGVKAGRWFVLGLLLGPVAFILIPFIKQK